MTTRETVTRPIQPFNAALHPVYARLLCAEMQSRGFEHAALLQGTGLEWDTLHRNNQFIKLEHMRSLVQRALQLSQCPWLGLEVGLRTPASAHGNLGAAVVASNNLAQAVALLQHYATLRQNLGSLSLDQGQELAVTLTEHVELGDIREYLLGQLLGGISCLIHDLVGQPLRDHVRIDWPFEQPAWHAQYQRLATQNRFGQPKLRVVFDPFLLQCPSLAADEEALGRLLKECDLQKQSQDSQGGVSARLRLWLRSHPQQLPTLAQAAAHEHLTERTLMRKLKAEGCSYQALLDEVRMERAMWQLAHSPYTVERIAYAVGYEDASNFSRTFKRWTGLTPLQYRAQATTPTSTP